MTEGPLRSAWERYLIAGAGTRALLSSARRGRRTLGSALGPRAPRVLQCPSNVAGQPWEYAEALRAHGFDCEVWVLSSHPFGYAFDVDLAVANGGVVERGLRLLRRTWAARKFDVIHFHSRRTLLPFHLDLLLFRIYGVIMVVTFHGTDVRLRSIAGASNAEFWRYGGTILNERRTRWRLRFLGSLIPVALASYRELVEYCAPYFRDVRILRSAIAVDQVRAVAGVDIRSLSKADGPDITVFHAPSVRNSKGTEFVVAAVEDLQRFGLNLQLEICQDAAHDLVLRKMGASDIVVDQLYLGSYGVQSVEAMALGKPVVCYINPAWRSYYPEDLPVISATASSLTDVLRSLATDPEYRASLGAMGEKYAREHHDRATIGVQLSALYTSLGLEVVT